jgi:hypothetical protein
MAKSTIPNPLERRLLIERDLDAKAAGAIAQAYLDEGRKIEAIDFLAKANDEAGLRAIGESAVADGDPFLLQSVARLTGDDPDRATWERCADAAQAAGKARYASTARRNAARSEA